MGRGTAHLQRGKIWPLVALVVLIVVSAVGGGAVWAIKKSHAQDDEDGGPPAKARSGKPAELPVFVRFDPFTVKLQPDPAGQEKYLQLLPELRALDAAAGERIKAYLPQIRHDMLAVLSARTPSELSTPQGIERLSVDLRKRANQSFGDPPNPRASGDKPGPDDTVQGVFFSSFIVQ